MAQRRSAKNGRGPVAHTGATDEFPGLGRVEQLVLRGDGLTTTSLTILTGEQIDVSVDGHWLLTVPGPSDRLPGGTMHFDQDGVDVDGVLATAVNDLHAQVEDVLLVREILLVGASGAVHGCAEVVALLHDLPPAVSSALAATDQPLGRLLRDNGVPVTRELHRWGLTTAGPRGVKLGVESSTRVPGRTYVMRFSNTGRPFAALTERFSPQVFKG